MSECDELAFEDRDERTIAVMDGGLTPAILWKHSGVWQLGFTALALTAGQVRQIANKLDELNNKGTVDAGH